MVSVDDDIVIACTLAVSKLFYPETEQTKTAIEVETERCFHHFLIWQRIKIEKTTQFFSELKKPPNLFRTSGEAAPQFFARP